MHQVKEERSMNLSFEKKVALVTGAGSGMGLSAAQALPQRVLRSRWLTSMKSASADSHRAPGRFAGHKAIAIAAMSPMKLR